jgi:hypothetical protein
VQQQQKVNTNYLKQLTSLTGLPRIHSGWGNGDRVCLPFNIGFSASHKGIPRGYPLGQRNIKNILFIAKKA